MDKKFGILSSSEDPQKLGDTVKGLVLGASVVIIWALQQAHVEVTSDGVTTFAVQLGTVVSSLWTAYGIIKKFLVWGYSRLH